LKQILLMSSLALAAACAPMPPLVGGPDPVPPENDRCRASVHQGLVGQHRSAIPATPPGATWRVSCSSCAVTMDYNPQRLNIVYDDRTEIIRSVGCG
jgi:hypothetical protein